MRKNKLKKLERKIRVAAVSYLNTKPLIYGFQNGKLPGQMELIFDYPSKIAAMLINDEVDLGLVPVAIIPFLNESHIISDYCIGADGEVASVCLFSDVPVEEIKTVYLDYQSRTSVALLKILLKHFYKISPEIIESSSGYENKINGDTGGLVIGDRAFVQRKKSKYIYDLSIAWKEMTGLPFVFAAWIANKKLPDSFISEFHIASAYGIENMDEAIENIKSDDYDLKKYFKSDIQYRLDDKKKEGLKLFLNYLKELD